MEIVCIWITVKDFGIAFCPESSGHNLDLNPKIMKEVVRERLIQ